MLSNLKGMAILIFLGGLAGCHNAAYAQPFTLDRDTEPVIISAQDLAYFNGVAFDDLFVYRYNSGTYTQIPFQFDDVGADSGYFSETNGILDDLDELCFMARDMGDRAPALSWLPDVDSQNYDRIEIQITDGLDPAKQGWVYVFRSSTLAYTAPQDYVTLSGATIASTNYSLTHNSQSIIDNLSILGGSGVDIVDREKIRVLGIIGGIITYEMTENAYTITNTQYKDGPIRVLKQALYNLTVGSLSYEKAISERYYDIISVTAGSVGLIMPEYGVTYLRQSLDLNVNAVNMMFYNDYNSGIPIDGIDDVINATVPDPGIIWGLVTGVQGTIIQLIDLPSLGNPQQLYYYDSTVGGTADIGTSETGDGVSYGDIGVSFFTPNTGIFKLGYTRVYLPPVDSNPDSVGNAFAARFAVPTAATFLQQPFVVVPVELSSFTAEYENGGVKLHWVTQSETENLGFYIYRAEGENSAFTKLNSKIFPGAGNTEAVQKYKFVDRNVSNHSTYFYQLADVDFTGVETKHDPIRCKIELPDTYSLQQNYPNPFNPATTIRYCIKESGFTSIIIYNLYGQRVKTLVLGNLHTGEYKAVWNGTDENGTIVSGGTYYCVMQSKQYKQTIKMTFLK
ncbi:hypothetical protein JW935_20215 [candidate division KSB1 bacterium]|nr:hypothetical protein [candidate division KSB1 bacterium]